VSNDILIKGTMSDEISAALARIEQRLADVERKLAEVGTAGRTMGDGVDAGASKASRSIDKAGRSAETAAPKIKKAGDEAEKAGAKAGLGSKGFKDFADKVEKAGKKSSDFAAITSAFRFGAIGTGIYAALGAISALGAGSVVAVAHVAPLLLNLLNLAPAGLAAAAAMAVFKLTSTQLAGPITQIKNGFSGLGNEIAGGGLLKGVQTLANDLRPLEKLSGQGLRMVGGDIGYAAGQLGKFIKQGSTLDSIRQIFDGISPIVSHVLDALIVMLPAVLAAIKAIIPVTDKMAYSLDNVAGIFSAWVQQAAASGSITRWMTAAWMGLHTAGTILWNILVALFNIFRDAYSASQNLGGGILGITQRFRDWTSSVSGQASIQKYFADAMPVVHDLGVLLGSVLRMIGHIAGGSNIGPLLNLIQSQLVPALGALLTHLTAVGSFGPAIVTLASNLIKIFSGLGFSGLSVAVNALVAISNWLVQLQKTVPAFNVVVSALLTTFLAFKLVTPILQGIGAALQFMTKIPAIIAGVSSAMETMGIVGLYAMDALSAGIGAVGTAIDAAFVSTPIGWIVLAIIAVIAIVVILWTKCAWFRDAVKAVWNAIKIATLAVWRAIQVAWNATINALVTAAKAVVGFFSDIWRAIVSVAMVIWNGLVVAWKFIWTIISTYVRIYIDVIKFIIQTAVYIIVAIITLIAIIVKGVWDLIAFGANWLWKTVLLPIFTLVGSVATSTWQGISAIAQWCWGIIVAGAQWLWLTILQPIFNLVGIVAGAVWTGISVAAQWCWNMITAGANAVWNGFLHPIFSFIGSVGSAVWTAIVTAAQWAWGIIKSVWSAVSGFFGGIWSGVEAGAKAVWGGIGNVISGVGNVVSGVWNAIVGAVKSVWNFIAKGWNSIPDIHVPDWVPGIGGDTFGLPKLPVLYRGGPTPGGPAVVGEHGPELLVRNNSITQVLGARGPQIADLPRGGYVVPNFRTIAAGMARPIPASVAAAIAHSGTQAAASAGGDRVLQRILAELVNALREQRPPINVAPGADHVRDQVLDALRDRDRETRAAGRYAYTAGRG
jgi:phage-related protein